MIKKIFNGIVWIFLQTISMKLIALISQLVLVWILSPEDFGKIALVNSITIFSNLIQQFGLQDVLIKRGKSFFLLDVENKKEMQNLIKLLTLVKKEIMLDQDHC